MEVEDKGLAVKETICADKFYDIDSLGMEGCPRKQVVTRILQKSMLKITTK